MKSNVFLTPFHGFGKKEAEQWTNRFSCRIIVWNGSREKQVSVYAPVFMGFAKVPPMAHRMMSAASFTIFQRQEKTK